MATLIRNGNDLEIVLSYEGSKVLKWWYDRCSLGKLIKEPPVLLKIIRAVDYDTRLSTVIPLEKAEMYELCMWYTKTIISDRDFHKPDILHRIVDLIRPHC